MHFIENSIYCYISESRHYNTTWEDLWPMTFQMKVNVTIIKKWWKIMPGFDSILIWIAKRKDGQSSRGKDRKALRFICSNNMHVHTYKSVHRWSVGGHFCMMNNPLEQFSYLLLWYGTLWYMLCLFDSSQYKLYYMLKGSEQAFITGCPFIRI